MYVEEEDAIFEWGAFRAGDLGTYFGHVVWVGAVGGNTWWGVLGEQGHFSH